MLRSEKYVSYATAPAMSQEKQASNKLG